jgi:CMP-N,N'-diacetyllegionaminic acid synthase
MNYITAVITVRSGSQRVKNKNLKIFCDKNLLEYKIEVLKKVKKIDEIIINTDSDEAIQISKNYNIGYKKREPYFASSECPNSEFWKNIAENTKSKFILFTHCTNPLIKKSTYEKFIEVFEKNKNNHDSFNSVTDVKEFLFLNKKPLNFDPSKSPNSQDLPNVIKLNFAINILTPSLMAKKKSLIGDNPFFYNLDAEEGYDINTKLDFEFAEYLFKKNRSQTEL